MTRSLGRPHTSLNLTPRSEIAAALGTSEATVKRLMNSAIAKLEAAGRLQDFYTLVRSAQIARAQRLAQAEEAAADFHPVVQCVSFECNRSAWGV